MARRLAVTLAVITLAAIALPRPVSSHETVNTTVLFDREIVRVLDSHCVMCHADGGPSFPLATYEDVWLQRRKISAAVIARRMPPWPAVSGYGRFANENAVTLRESQFVVSWMEGLGPRNAGKVFTNIADPSRPKTEPVRARADLGAWPLGAPDVTLDLPPATLEPNQPDEIRRIVVESGFAVARTIRAIEYRPGDRRVVRAAFFSVEETGQWIGSWTPWHGFQKLPDRVVYRVAAGSHLVATIHYQHAGVRVVDRGQIGVLFDARPGAIAATDLVLGGRRDAPSGPWHAEAALTSDTRLLAVRPDLPAGVTSLEVKARRPDGGTDVLLFAKDFSPRWPTPFIFAEPVLVRRGSVLAVIAHGGEVSRPADLRVSITRAN